MGDLIPFPTPKPTHDDLVGTAVNELIHHLAGVTLLLGQQEGTEEAILTADADALGDRLTLWLHRHLRQIT